MLVLIGATPEGKKELLGFQVGMRESAQSWRELPVDLRARGLTIAPELATGDGALGFWKALDEVSPTTRHQRCTAHNAANILNKVPKSVQSAVKADLREVWNAPDRATAEAAVATFAEKYGTKYEKATTCLVKDRDALTELVTFSRPRVVSTLAEIGLMLAETKTLLARLQASMLCGQVAERADHHRLCAACGVPQPLKDRRTRRLQMLFGTVEVEAPRFKVCRCRRPAPLAEVTVSPVCALLTARCTPELERVQAELGARTSFRDGARILQALLPVSPANHESLRTRTHAVALRIEAADRRAAAEVMAVPDKPAKIAAADASRPTVMLDGVYVRAVPGHQTRNFEAICGKVEREGHATRRFALVCSVAGQPHALLRAALLAQGWREGEAVTAISDGDPPLPASERSATDGPVQRILDWFHLSMRVHHVEQVMRGLCALEPPPLAPLDHVQIDVERLRHLLWKGYHDKACEALGRIAS